MGRDASQLVPDAAKAAETTVVTFVISLRRAEGRRAAMRAELAQAGVTATFFDALDMSQTPEAEFLKDCRRDGAWGHFHTRNMACTLSHARVWEAFLAGGADLCLVLEDDVFLSADLGAWLDDLSWWPEGADVVKIERWRSDGLKVLLDTARTAHLGRSLRRLLSRHSGSAGYLLTRKAARQLLAAKPYSVSIDQLLFNANASPVARRMRLWQVQPALAEQGNDPAGEQSLVEDRERPQGLALLRQKLARGLREIAYPPSVVMQLISGRARLESIRFEPRQPKGPLAQTEL